MITGSGRIFDLYNPTPEMIDIEDIAGALAKQCRWNGNIPDFYSVAQHSCVVSWLAPTHLNFAALMHDAAEAYTGDIIRPLKKMLAHAFFEIEDRIEKTVWQKFNIAPELVEAVKEYDNQALQIEYRAFYHNDMVAEDQIRHLSAVRLKHTPVFTCWDPESAKINFLYNYFQLTKKNKSNIYQP